MGALRKEYPVSTLLPHSAAPFMTHVCFSGHSTFLLLICAHLLPNLLVVNI